MKTDLSNPVATAEFCVYKLLALESKEITGCQFVWFTDGIGWNSAKHNLEETFDVLDNLYNLEDLENGAMNNLTDSALYLKNLLKGTQD